MDSISEPTRALALHIARAKSIELPLFVRERAKIHFLDSIAAVVSGSAMPAGKAGASWLDAVVREVSGPCADVGTEQTTIPFASALANGMSAHADETDDSHADSLSHPGCAVAPAVLAVGEETGASGEDVLRSFV